MQTSDLEERVRALLGRLERPPEHPAPGGASEREIAALAGTLGVAALPGELAAWLRVCRGEAIGPGGVFGIRPDDADHDIAATLARRPAWRERGWLPVAGDGCGNSYVLLTAGPLTGFVGFVDTIADPDGLDCLVASGLWQFLRFLFEREQGRTGWPFDQEVVLTQDPDLASAPRGLQPWPA